MTRTRRLRYLAEIKTREDIASLHESVALPEEACGKSFLIIFKVLILWLNVILIIHYIFYSTFAHQQSMTERRSYELVRELVHEIVNFWWTPFVCLAHELERNAVHLIGERDCERKVHNIVET